jgi:hypothetical protein
MGRSISLFDELQQHFLPDAGHELLAHARPGPALHHAHPAGIAVVVSRVGMRSALPMELHLDTAHGIGVQLIGTAGCDVAGGPHDDG